MYIYIYIYIYILYIYIYIYIYINVYINIYINDYKFHKLACILFNLVAYSYNLCTTYVIYRKCLVVHVRGFTYDLVVLCKVGIGIM